VECDPFVFVVDAVLVATMEVIEEEVPGTVVGRSVSPDSD
jgi:hypothetical protein